jgi:hypothetical protein
MTSKITLPVIKEYLEKKSYFSPVQEPVAFNGKFKVYRTNKEEMVGVCWLSKIKAARLE